VDVSGVENEGGCAATMSGEVAVSRAAALPVLADPIPRVDERVLARFGLIASVSPVFTGCARAPLTR